MSRVDYSKWDNIELSDDEDIECHPNIDKKSFVRMRQRKIHEERSERRHGIEQYGKQLTWLDKYIQALERIDDTPSEEVQNELKNLMTEFEGVPDELQWTKVQNHTKETWELFRMKLRMHKKVVESERDRLSTEESKKLAVDVICKPGFDSKTRVNVSKPSTSTTPSASNKTKKETVEVIEVLNPKGVEMAQLQVVDSLYWSSYLTRFQSNSMRFPFPN
jgi:cell division cycle protein 37